MMATWYCRAWIDAVQALMADGPCITAATVLLLQQPRPRRIPRAITSKSQSERTAASFGKVSRTIAYIQMTGYLAFCVLMRFIL